MTNEELSNLFKFHSNYGILFLVQSLLSCFSNEVNMLFEHYCALRTLNYVYIHFPNDFDEFLKSEFLALDITIERYSKLMIILKFFENKNYQFLNF
jgi:hypothetical protein